jgi:hypothetical protein
MKFIKRIVFFPAGRKVGLGDAVAVVAQPIARVIDAATGHRTNVVGCGGCKQRQETLNQAVSDVFHPFT